MEDVLSRSSDDWGRELAQIGEPAYRGRQVFHALWADGLTEYDRLTVWPKALRAWAAEHWPLKRARLVARQTAPDGTSKLLLELGDGQQVETVLLPHRYGWSVCVSTQVGCAMGCHFCASGIGGKVRNLSPGEIADQVVVANAVLAERGARVGRVDMMGIGEPLDNYAGTVGALRLMHEPLGLNLSYRHVTVSTSGLVPRIRRLAEEGLPVTLAVSLHAPNDALRTALMPVNRAFPLAQLMSALRVYWQKTGRRLTYEYLLIDGVNDSEALAEELVRLVGGFPCHVNLIPWNPVPEFPYRPSPRLQVDRFRQILTDAGISCTVRRQLGRDIDAACGQLRRHHAGAVEVGQQGI